MERQELIRRAFEARKKSYAPYSHFQVGAALLCEDGEIFEGCNIENAAYGATNCAERTAFFKAVSQGKRKFKSIAIVGKPENGQEFEYCAPCGICRQVMAEFCEPQNFEIILPRSGSDYRVYKLEQLLPLSFTEENLRSK